MQIPSLVPAIQVAARLVEVLSGEPFGRYLRHHVFEPAQMSATTSTASDDEPVPAAAAGTLLARSWRWWRVHRASSLSNGLTPQAPARPTS
jgi:CubicO group peptidase (beta-lactamase class C family)